MQQLMAMVLSLELFVMCISTGFWFFGEQLNMSTIKHYSLNITTLNRSFNATVLGYETNPYNPAFIFGDFGRGITQFMQIVTGNYFFGIMGLFGFPESFIIAVSVIYFFAVIGTLIYLISGRG